MANTWQLGPYVGDDVALYDAVPNLESLSIHDEDLICENLPEEELWRRSTLQLVELSGVFNVPDKMQTMVTDFENKYPDNPCKININSEGGACTIM